MLCIFTFLVLAARAAGNAEEGACFETSNNCGETGDPGFTTKATLADCLAGGITFGSSWALTIDTECIPFGYCYTIEGCPDLVARTWSGEDQCEESGGKSWVNAQGLLPDDCVDFESEGSDPHFTTFRGNKFDYHGECDLVLVHNPVFDNGRGLNIHIRTTRFNFFSFIESVAIQIGNATMEIDNKAQLRVGEHIYTSHHHQDDYDDMMMYPSVFAGYAFSHDMSSKRGMHIHIFHMTLASDKNQYESIKIHIWDMFVGVFVNHGDQTSLFEGSSGMMGDFVTGEKVGRDGETMTAMMTDSSSGGAVASALFAAEWQVRSDGTDPILFHDVRAPVHPQACFVPEQTGRGLVSAATRQAAEAACARWGEAGMKDCVYDVIATGNLDMADAEVY